MPLGKMSYPPSKPSIYLLASKKSAPSSPLRAYFWLMGRSCCTIKTLFTTDLRQNSETLEKSLVEFKIDEATGKYKKEEIDLKLLG